MMGQVTAYNLDRLRTRLYSLQTDLATATRLHKPSDDPAAVADSMRLRSSLDRMTRYEINVSDAKSRLDRTESALNHLTALVGRVRELVVQSASDTMSAESREAAAKEVSQLLLAMVDVANSDYAGRYIFGGQQTGSKPFVVSATPTAYGIDQYTVTYNGPGNPDQEHVYREIAPGVKIQVNVGGEQLRMAGGHDLFARVQEVVDHLLAGDQDSLSNQDLANLSEIEDGLLGIRASVGARSQTTEMAQQRLVDLRVALESNVEQVEGIDVARTLIRFNQEEVAYQTALGISGRILPRTLLDYLR